MEKDPTKIVEVLAEGNVKISCWGVIKFLQIFQEMPHQRIQPEVDIHLLLLSTVKLNFNDREMGCNNE